MWHHQQLLLLKQPQQQHVLHWRRPLASSIHCRRSSPSFIIATMCVVRQQHGRSANTRPFLLAAPQISAHRRISGIATTLLRNSPNAAHKCAVFTAQSSASFHRLVRERSIEDWFRLSLKAILYCIAYCIIADCVSVYSKDWAIKKKAMISVDQLIQHMKADEIHTITCYKNLGYTVAKFQPDAILDGEEAGPYRFVRIDLGEENEREHSLQRISDAKNQLEDCTVTLHIDTRNKFRIFYFAGAFFVCLTLYAYRFHPTELKSLFWLITRRKRIGARRG